MTHGGMRRNLIPGIVFKIGFPLLVGLIALAAGDVGGMTGRSALVMAAVIMLGLALFLFMIDTEMRFSAAEDRTAQGLDKISRSAELSGLMERSVLDTALLTDFLETAGGMDGRVNPLLQRLARREIERVTSFVRQLPVGVEMAYDGEDRDWLLGLTRDAERSIDAISLSTVDAGMRGFDGGLWTSDLGTRYLELQREAITRQVVVRRIFVFENKQLSRDETFRKITRMQREVGIQVRMLDHQLIPDHLRSMIFDYIVFDGAVSYETTPATTFAAGQTRPAVVRTVLAPMPDRVRDLGDQFERLWTAADPDREMPPAARERLRWIGLAWSGKHVTDPVDQFGR